MHVEIGKRYMTRNNGIVTVVSEPQRDTPSGSSYVKVETYVNGSTVRFDEPVHNLVYEMPF